MNTRKLTAVAVAVLLGAGGALGATTAWADDGTPPADPAVTAPAVDSPPVTDPTPDASAPDAATDSAPSDPAPAARTVNTETKLAICHTGNGTNWSYIAPDAEGYNGHQHHDLDVYGLSEADCLAKNTPTPAASYVTVAWAMPSWINSTTPSWPQTYVTSASTSSPALNALDGQLTACGAQWQVDVYNDNATTASLIAGAHLDGPGNPPESLIAGGWGTAYKLIQGPACPPAPQACAVAGPAYTEDGFPTFTADGQQYGNPDASVPAPGHALNWLVPVTGNLQGFTSASYTISAASGYQAAFRFVLFANGTTGYTSVTAEPYLNGWSAGQTGTFTITPATLVWNSHIATGPGSQSQPVSITDMAALIPANQLISEGIHSGSSFVAGQYTVVSALTGCVSYSAPPKLPEPYSTFSEWSDGVYGCGDTTQVQTRTRVDVTFGYDEAWNVVEHDSDPVTETQTVDLTAEQIAALDCPVVTPTPTPTPEGPKALATTGTDTLVEWGTPALLVAGLGILLSALGLLYTRRRDDNDAALVRAGYDPARLGLRSRWSVLSKLDK